MLSKIDGKVLVTGAAGFIGSAVAERLASENISVLGVDNLNSYYDVRLKQDRLERIRNSKGSKNFKFIELNIRDKKNVDFLFKKNDFNFIIHLAAQAGVRYSLENPQAYIDSNIQGFFNLLEASRISDRLEHFLYASSSSVYGGNNRLPYSESCNINSPVSLYAATKASNELMAFSYSHLFNIPLTGVRLFTVYGPWGRPDMAVFSFVKKILSRDKLKLFNNGDMKRDFTYIDDVVEGIVRLLCSLPTSPTISLKDYSSGNAASRIVNIGNSNPVSLMDFVSILENILGIKADIEFSAFQAGDVKSTFADMRKFKSLTGFEFQTPLLKGLKEFVDWYKDYYKKND